MRDKKALGKMLECIWAQAHLNSYVMFCVVLALSKFQGEDLI